MRTEGSSWTGSWPPWLSSGTERRSRTQLTLDTTSAERASTLGSIAELNDAATSYQKVRLTFGDSSTVATLSGLYAAGGAAAGATSLKLQFTETATIGHSSGTLKFQVLDQNDAVLYTFDGVARAGESLSLGSDLGLQVSFSAGSAAANASAKTTVSASTATSVDRYATFNDPDLNNRPRFQGGPQVQAGSFLVNGVNIEVRADDSIDSVLQRISETIPGVSASFTSDKVVLESRSPSTRRSSIANDTSGFVAAARLTGAVSERGHVRADREPLARLAQFANVRPGGFNINGLFVSVHPATDTLAGTLARVRNLAASVQAYYDPGERAVFLREAGKGTVFSDDTSGFLGAVGISQESSPTLEPRFQLNPGIAQSIARLLDGNLAGLAAETRREPEPAARKDAPDAARRAQAAYQQGTWAEGPNLLNASLPRPSR